MNMKSSHRDDSETQIRAVIEAWVGAFRNRDTDAAMAVHAPEVVSLDIVPPLRYRGAGDYRRPGTQRSRSSKARS